MVGRRLSTIAVLAGAFALLVSAAARAGCGDYLTVEHGARSEGAAAAQSLNAATAPCNGPNCHRQEAPPLTPTSELPVIASSDKAATTVAVVANEMPAFAQRLSESDLQPASGFGRYLLRPPRGV